MSLFRLIRFMMSYIEMDLQFIRVRFHILIHFELQILVIYNKRIWPDF